MKEGALYRLLLAVLLVIMAGNTAMAQENTPVLGDDQPYQTPDSVIAPPLDSAAAKEDSIKRKRFYTRKVTYTVGSNTLDVYPIDTFLDDKQYYDPANFEYRNLGNLGLPAVPIVFKPLIKPGFDLGYHQFDIYTFRRENLRFYDSRIPYTHLFFLFGMRKEQMVDVLHNQNIGQRFNLAFQFRRYASEGTYEGQETAHNNFAITTRYISRSEQYKFTAMLMLNSMDEQENGGLVSDDVYGNDTSETSSLAGVELTGASSEYKDLAVVLRQEWRQGENDTVKLTDTTMTARFFPEFTIYHELTYGNKKYEFMQGNPDATYYGDFLVNADTLLSVVRHRYWANTIGFSLSSVRGADTSGAIYRNYFADVSLYHSLGGIQQDPLRAPIQELRLTALLRNHPDSRKGLVYSGSFSYDLADYNQHDLKADGQIGFNLKKIGTLLATGSFSRLEVPWIYNNFYYQALEESNDFLKTITLTAGLAYEIPKFRFRVSGQFYNITYPVYFNADRLPAQAPGSVQGWVVKAMKNFRWRHFGSDHLFVLQLFTGQDIYRYPTFWTKNTLFYENSLFKNNLMLRAGVDLFYNTNYNGYGYFPLTGQFHVQDNLKLSFYPVADLFISLKIAEAVVFIKVEHINQGIFKRDGYYAAYKYPVADRSFKIGVSWRFYN